ncbi:MAG TPA: APC family permease [Vicinamibacteria bacterium]|nr:APC family permease [Vicinamibacteria bacterium]
MGLAVFASDALSSTAYATQEILVVLALAGTAAFHHALPISVAIVALLSIVTLSYRQTIHAYPGGGGAYVVARDNLGELPAQVAGAALLTDYILTVAVSVSSGVAQIASAFPIVYAHRVAVSVACVLLVGFVNLRGVKESGKVFAVPTYFFIVMLFLTVGLGFVRYFFGALGTVPEPPPLEIHASSALTLFVLLHAFSNGTTALTGIEAISNGIMAFREPRSHNAAVTLLWMAGILSTLFLGISFLAVHAGAVPSEIDTVISQLARTVYGGRELPYLLTIAATTLILIMAANTAFADFPRLGALQAEDGFLPRQLAYRGSRLVFSRGIALLSIVASLLIVAFEASVTGLIPLYAIGVFLSFTLSQAGMARRWWKSGQVAPGAVVRERSSELRHEPSWRWRMALNGFGAIMTAAVMLVFAVTKFGEGAWIIVILIPLLVFVFVSIHGHYRDLAGRLSLEAWGVPPRVRRHRVILAVSGVHRGTVAALRYARALSDDITAVHVSISAAESEALKAKWGMWGNGVRLVVLESPYRLLLEPLLDYIQGVERLRQPGETLTIVVPQFVPRRSWHNLLHAQTAVFLRLALLFRPGIVITNVPYHVDLEPSTLEA